jgi:predicted Zn-dependent protease
MRWILLVGFFLCAGPAQAENIVEVLQRSQQSRLELLRAADPDSVAARTLQARFERLLQITGIDNKTVALRVIDGATVAETLLGKVVVVNAALTQRPEVEQLFILAHELGHVIEDHQAQMGQVYLKWVPGPVLQEHTDAVAPMLGREASGLAHRQEFSADAFALRTLCAMGHSRDEVLATFMRMGMFQATATHPASNKRLAALRVAPADEAAPALLAEAR